MTFFINLRTYLVGQGFSSPQDVLMKLLTNGIVANPSSASSKPKKINQIQLYQPFFCGFISHQL